MKRCACFCLRGAMMVALIISLAACASSGSGARQAAQSTPPPTTTASQRIDVIQIITPPTAINWDDRPGPDGVPVTIYLFRRDRAEPVTLQSGEITFLLYEGRVGMAALREEPFHSWTYSARGLQGSLDQTMFGYCYKLPLAWGARVPRAANITLIARYQPVDGSPVYSAPNALAVKAD